MTIGQRIALKRKEQNLSQEALGERLGVTRQSIYKWESNAALPEIEKLVALSRLFGVSVGWLLGVEDPPPESAAPESPPADSGELTEAQLQMVEEIVSRYIAAQPAAKPRWKWPWVLAALVLALAVFSLFRRLDRVDRQYNNLQNSVNSVTSSVNSQIGGISQQVEELLKSQNALTADYRTELAAVNLSANTATFSVYAVPKTYVDGMTVEFIAENGEVASDRVARAGEAGSNQRFSADISIGLTDDITLSALFITPDGTRRTQVLDTYKDLYSSSLPQVDVTDNLSSDALAEPFLFTIPASNRFPVRYTGVTRKENGVAAAIRELRIGLFKNQALVAWAEPCDRPSSFLGDYLEDCWEFYALPDLQERLDPGDTLCFAAVMTDEYGRTLLCPSIPVTMDETGKALISPSSFIMRTIAPDGWEFG